MPFKYDFTRLQSRQQLIDFLELNEQFFEEVLAFVPRPESFSESLESGIYVAHIPLFIRHDIPKKNRQRGHRIVWEPTYLKNHYKALARRLANFFSNRLDPFPHPRTFGYLTGRNIRENARDHCGHRYLISIDLTDFFPSITAARIAASLLSVGVTPIVADLLSRFVTIGGSLPLGLPTSPTLSNAICLPMDIELETLARRFEATFSRYADDISFSSDRGVPSQDELAACVKRYGFDIAESKTRISKLGQAHYVTGLSVSDPIQPHVPRTKKRRLRQELYYAGKYGLGDHFRHLGINDERIIQHEINRLDGLVKFTAYHEPRLSTRLKMTWVKILQASGDSPSFEPKGQHKIPFYIYVDEAEFLQPTGDRLLALAMAVSQHQDEINRVTREVLESTLSDMWAAGNRKAIERKGIHFADATEDMRLAYIERMRFLPFQGYVAMAVLHRSVDYETTYLRLLNSMIKRRLMAAESQFACLVFEQNDKVSQEAVRAVVMGAYESLRKQNNRHPTGCDVEFATKPNLGMSVADFLLGVLGKYLASGPEKEGKPLTREKLLFERIRDKYRLILDLDNWTEYTRRRPIAPWHEMIHLKDDSGGRNGG